MKHFINLIDIPASHLRKIVNDAKKRKTKRKNLNLLLPDKDIPLKGKFLIQMFEKSSLRTRLSFYLAIRQLGGEALNLRKNELHFGEGGESVHDTAKIISNYGDIFMLRTDSDKKLEIFKMFLLGRYFFGEAIFNLNKNLTDASTKLFKTLFVSPIQHN